MNKEEVYEKNGKWYFWDKYLNKETELFDQKKYAEKAKKLHAKFAFNMGLDK